MGPELAGVLITWVGAATTFYLAGAGSITFAVFLAAVHMPLVVRSASAKFAQDMLDGLLFIRRNHIFTFLLGMTFQQLLRHVRRYAHAGVPEGHIKVNPTGLWFLLAAGGV